MDENDVRSWFGRYLEAFAVCGRGESDDVDGRLASYAVPLLVTTDEEVATLGVDEIATFTRQQVQGMRAAAYDHSDTLHCDVVVVNQTSVLLTAGFVRRRRDGSELGHLGVTYLIVDGPVGRRIAAMLVHRPLPGQRQPAADR